MDPGSAPLKRLVRDDSPMSLSLDLLKGRVFAIAFRMRAAHGVVSENARHAIPFFRVFLYVQRNIAVPRPAPPLVLRAADPPAPL